MMAAMPVLLAMNCKSASRLCFSNRPASIARNMARSDVVRSLNEMTTFVRATTAGVPGAGGPAGGGLGGAAPPNPADGPKTLDRTPRRFMPQLLLRGPQRSAACATEHHSGHTRARTARECAGFRHRT